MRPGVRFLGIGAGFVLFFALVFSIVSTGHQARADTTPLKISIGYISEAIPEPDPLSLVEIVPKDKGITGLRLAIEDDNTTGKFLKQTYELIEKVVPQGGDLPQAAKELAGAGIKGGHVHGATDDFSYNIVEDPVHIHDLNATALYLLGLDHTRLTYRFQGRDYRLTDIHGNVVQEILA